MPVDDEHALQLATAALLLEVVRADRDIKEEEVKSVESAVTNMFGLTGEETGQLIALAEQEVEEATSLFQFTSLVDKHYPLEKKIDIVKLLWRVAFSDAHKDMHEEYLVRRIADLLHVPHLEFIRMRHIVENEL